jgi:ABC-type glycerol-3-phosphate transport system permease component
MTRKRLQIFHHLIIWLMLFLAIYPLIMTVFISMKNPYQFDQGRWTLTFPLRMGNYGAAWGVVKQYMLNTFLVGFVGLSGVVIMSLVGGHVFAVMRFRGKKVLFGMIIALLSVPFVLSFIPSYVLYYKMGLVNSRWGLIIPNLANGPVFGIFLLRSTLAGVPKAIYEASEIDGANVFQDIFHISLPLGATALATLSVSNFLGTWNWFLWPLVIITDKSKQLISVGITKLAIETSNNWGPEFAGYIIASLPLLLIFVFLGRYYVEGAVSSGLKM